MEKIGYSFSPVLIFIYASREQGIRRRLLTRGNRLQKDHSVAQSTSIEHQCFARENQAEQEVPLLLPYDHPVTLLYRFLLFRRKHIYF